MLRLYYSLFFLFTSVQITAVAQSDSTKNTVKKPLRSDEVMCDQIMQLKGGILLVRLQTKENAINALLQVGNNKLANEVRDKQLKLNKEIVWTFKKHFTFCPVFFFYNNFTDTVLSGNFNGVVFLNDSLKPDTTIRMVGKNYLTAEFGLIDPDTAKYYSDNSDYMGEDGLERRNEYYGGANQRFEVLKIMSDRFVQLRRPFPYYVKSYDPYPDKEKIIKAVKKMNNNLFNFYKKCS
jgi:hypothetical protein